MNDETHRECAEILYKCLEKNGGCYIKLGQIIAQLENLVPEIYSDKMKPLMQSCKEVPFEKIEKTLNEEFHGDYKKYFAYVDPKPLGTASLAQVHKGKLFSGETIVLKIQHERLLPESKGDIYLIKSATSLGEYIFTDFKYKWLGKQFETNLLKELDFLREGRNAERLQEMFKNNKQIIIPKIYWDLSSKKILVMDFQRGGPIEDPEYLKQNKINIIEVAKLLTECFNEQIFRHGFVHADPHAGNIFVRKNNMEKLEMVILDHGLYRELDEEFRFYYSLFWRGVITQNQKIIKYSCKKLQIEYYELFTAIVLNKRYDEVMSNKKKYLSDKRFANLKSKSEKEEVKEYALKYSKDITHVLAGVREEMLLLLKINEFLRSIDRKLGSPLNNFEIMVNLKFI